MHVNNDSRVCTLLSFLISMTFHDFFEELSQFCMALVLAAIFENYTLLEAGTKVGLDQLGPPVRVRSTRINSDQLRSNKKMKIK